ncbi:MAG: hypothetical protein IT372_09515 [Polyangiaceae bacterium]|nr:hypothetical protein [Polyangiaceae bacterium]
MASPRLDARTAGRSPLSALALALALAALPACAAGAAKSGGAAAALGADEPLPGDVEGTIALLDRAEADLAGAIGGAPARRARDGQPAADAPAGGEAAPEPAPPPPPPATQAAPAAEKPAGAAPAKEEQEMPVSASPCATACRALASMRRAAEHLCGLAGQEDARCGSARERVQRAGERVHAACPACSE